jgi:hypothetical protein
MREVSPVEGMTVNQALEVRSWAKETVAEIRRMKASGNRLRSSITLIDRSAILTSALRANRLDKVATLVDENYVGRCSEMCAQFADLLCRALKHLGFSERGVLGTDILQRSRQ